MKKMKENYVAKIIDFGLVFIAWMSLIINAISFYALQHSEYRIIPWLPVIMAIFLIGLALMRKKIALNIKAGLFILTLISGALFSLSIGLLDIASLWFVAAIIYSIFIDKKKALYVFLFSFISMLITGVLIMMKLENFPIDYKFDSCLFACVAIRIVNFFIIGYLIYYLFHIFLSTIDLYVENLSEKNKILGKLNLSLQKQMEEKTKNEHLKISLAIKEKELENKKVELSELTTKMIAFNKVLMEIESCVIQNNLEEAKRIIKYNTYSNYNWERFKYSFEEVYPYFFKNLRSTYSNITDNELKLSAFLLLKLRTKDIAKIMAISENSVSKNRNRLRKKLNIDSQTKLSVFLENIASMNISFVDGDLPPKLSKKIPVI
jgi:DNA-binding CsgD family transcriptional regulator